MNSQTNIKLTATAAKHIQSTITKQGVALFRLSITQTGCTGYMYVPELVDAPKQGDICVENEFNVPFYVDAKYIDILDGTVIDYVEKSLGMSQLDFKNPNADSLCGCGESFNLKGDSDD